MKQQFTVLSDTLEIVYNLVKAKTGPFVNF